MRILHQDGPLIAERCTRAVARAGGDRYLWFPLSAPAGLLAIPPTLWLRGKSHRRRRVPSAELLCPRCGYDLRVSPERCPECGAGQSAGISN